MATVAKGYDLDYAWRAVGETYRGAGYYLAAAEAGEGAADEAAASEAEAAGEPDSTEE